MKIIESRLKFCTPQNISGAQKLVLLDQLCK